MGCWLRFLSRHHPAAKWHITLALAHEMRQLRMSALGMAMYKYAVRRGPELGLPRGQLLPEVLITAPTRLIETALSVSWQSNQAAQIAVFWCAADRQRSHTLADGH